MLAEIKTTQHGEWMAWCEANLEFSKQTEQNYRKLYEHRSKLTGLVNLGPWEALQLCNDSRPKPR